MNAFTNKDGATLMAGCFNHRHRPALRIAVRKTLMGRVGLRATYAAQCAPAWEIGGDLYHVFDTDEGETVAVFRR